MSQQVTHLIIFALAAIALVILIVTGHDGDGTARTLLFVVLGGVVGGAGSSSIGTLISGNIDKKGE